MIEIEMIRIGTMILFLAACCYWDGCYRQLPCIWLAAGGAAGVLLMLILKEDPGKLLWGTVPGICFLALSLIFPQQIGAGDGWMILVSGMIGGWKECLLLLQYGFFLMTPAAMYMIFFKKERERTLPFAPFVMGGYLCRLLIS